MKTDGKDVYLLGLDPGLANLGWSVIKLTADSETVVELGVFRTDKSDKKRKVLASDDNVRRAREVSHLLRTLLGKYNIAAMCCESMSFPRNSSAAAKMALSWGVIVALADSMNIAIMQASPQEIKKKLCGKKDASKEDIEEAVKSLFPPAKALITEAPSIQNHAWDATAAIVTCLDNDSLRAIRRFV